MNGLAARFARAERGGISVEYSIIAVLISIGIIAGLTIIGPAVMEMFSDAEAPF